jgi:hypothetical protein
MAVCLLNNLRFIIDSVVGQLISESAAVFVYGFKSPSYNNSSYGEGTFVNPVIQTCFLIWTRQGFHLFDQPVGIGGIEQTQPCFSRIAGVPFLFTFFPAQFPLFLSRMLLPARFFIL